MCLLFGHLDSKSQYQMMHRRYSEIWLSLIYSRNLGSTTLLFNVRRQKPVHGGLFAAVQAADTVETVRIPAPPDWWSRGSGMLRAIFAEKWVSILNQLFSTTNCDRFLWRDLLSKSFGLFCVTDFRWHRVVGPLLTGWTSRRNCRSAVVMSRIEAKVEGFSE